MLFKCKGFVCLIIGSFLVWKTCKKCLIIVSWSRQISSILFEMFFQLCHCLLECSLLSALFCQFSSIATFLVNPLLIFLDFYQSCIDVLYQCSFYFIPLSILEYALFNCFHVNWFHAEHPNNIKIGAFKLLTNHKLVSAAFYSLTPAGVILLT